MIEAPRVLLVVKSREVVKGVIVVLMVEVPSTLVLKVPRVVVVVAPRVVVVEAITILMVEVQHGYVAKKGT